MNEEPVRITIRELKEQLAIFDEDAELLFGPGGQDELTFYRTKSRGDDLVQIEFNELFKVTDRP